tara:strand:+ start:705 stop:1436 length:732 start_codon:yes stop_codon:yes gene_type:complete
MNKIYSYGHHYLLGEFIDNNTIVINDDGYSVTTSGHISQIKYATRQYKQYLKSQTDLETVHHMVMYNKTKLANARKPELYITPILRTFEVLNEFLTYTKAKRYKSDSRYKAIKNVVQALNDNSEDFKAKLKEAELKRKKSEARKNRKLIKEKLSDFLSYEIRTFRVGSEDYLRLSQDGKKVETSQGISIQRDNAKTLYNLILRGVSVKGVQIEGYTVISINGTLKIGCHNINIDSVHKVGKQL